MRRDQLARDLGERLVDECRLGVERGGQRLERRRARGQFLAVACELELRIDALAPDVGEVVDIQAREVARLVGRAQAAERPSERVVAAGRRERCEPGPFGQELAADDAQRKARIATLQEADRGLDRRNVALRMLQKVRDRRWDR